MEGAPSSTSFATRIRQVNPERLSHVMRGLNAFTSALLLLTGVIALISINLNPLYILFSLYTIMFSAVLLVFELRLHKIDAFVADNFGFLFSWNGRAFFLFFLASMTFGLDPQWLSILTSIITLICILINTFILCSNPEVGPYLQRHCLLNSDYAHNENESNRSQYRSPNMRENAASSAVRAAADHPEVASTGVDLVAKNPESAKRVAAAFTGNSSASSRAVDMIGNNPEAAKSAIGFAAKHKDVAADVAGGVWDEMKDDASPNKH